METPNLVEKIVLYFRLSITVTLNLSFKVFSNELILLK